MVNNIRIITVQLQTRQVPAIAFKEPIEHEQVI